MCLLLLSICGNIPSLNKQSLLPPHTVHISLGHILLVGQLTKILEIVFRERYPERIFIKDLKACKDELRLSSATGTLTHLICKSETLGHRDQGLNGEKWCTFFHKLCIDPAPAAGQDIIHTPEDFCRCLDLDTVHSEHETGRPVHKACTERRLKCPDDLTSQTAQCISNRGVVFGNIQVDVLDKDSNTLERLMAKGALGRGKLEGVGDLVCKMARVKRLICAGSSLDHLLSGKSLGKNTICSSIDKQVGPSSPRPKCHNLINRVFPSIPALASLKLLLNCDIRFGGNLIFLSFGPGLTIVDSLDGVSVLQEKLGHILRDWITLYEKLETMNHLVQIGRVHWFQRDTNNRLAQHSDTCKVDSAFATTAQSARLENLTLETSNTKDTTSGN
ncbi:hypothetical protein HG530_005959 [Fusarium avenaceum]|nr:hypothetical protein HG530_005959 [Fusarium avenaceum]